MSDLPAHRLKQAKRALRREILAERDALRADERSARSEAIADRFLDLPEAAGARTVLGFWSFGSEVDTAPLIARLRSQGTTVALPRIEGNEVVPVVATPGAAMTETSFGAMEPADGRVLEVAELDLVVVPGVAFDRSCDRVGYGGGFYDRTLAESIRPATVGVAYSGQRAVFTPGPHDVALDVIFTERPEL